MRNFENALQEHGKSVYLFIYSQVKHKVLAEDLYQETLLSVYLAFPTIQESSKLKNWLFTIAANKCRDYWRKENKTKHFWKEEVYSYSAVIELTPLLEERVLLKDYAIQMAEKVKTLPEIYQKPIFLYFYKDYSIKEISMKTNLPISTVKTRIKRAKERLRTKLQSLA
jgi:RNA polymerase sigma factor (sigma-70 family)